MKPTVEIQNRDITRDPREDEDWFLRLPSAVRDEIRESWRDHRVRFEPWAAGQRQFRNRCLREGVLVCAIPAMLVLLASPWPLLLSVPFGMATGYIWWRVRSGRLMSGPIAIVAVICELTFGGFWSSGRDVAGFALSMLSALLAGWIAAGLGLRRELDGG